MKILLYCGIDNILQFIRIRPQYDACYIFDPAHAALIGKIFPDDPNIFFQEGALNPDSPGEVLYNNVYFNNEWLLSLGVLNPEIAEITSKVHYFDQLKVNTINLSNFLAAKAFPKINTLMTNLRGMDLAVLKSIASFLDQNIIDEIYVTAERDDKPPLFRNLPSNKLSGFVELLKENYEYTIIENAPVIHDWEIKAHFKRKGATIIDSNYFNNNDNTPATVQAKPATGLRPVIHCIGDSHVNFFSGRDSFDGKSDNLPFFATYFIGSYLSYNIARRQNLIEAIIDRRVASGDKILFCFGEIDCRANLVKQAKIQEKSIDAVVDVCVERYMELLKKLKSQGREVIAWAVPPSPTGEIKYGNYSTSGTFAERQSASILFNKALEKQCRENSINFVSIFDYVLDERSLPNRYFFMDKIHYSQNAMPLALFEMKKQGLLTLNNDESVALAASYNTAVAHRKFLHLESIKSENDSLTADFLEKIANLFHVDVFVETGTLTGGTSAEAAKIFREVYTIELSRELFLKAVQRFQKNDNVHVYHGNSAIVLHDILPNIQGRVLFWINGCPSGLKTACGKSYKPIISEIAAIGMQNRKDSVILIDDLRCFYRNVNPSSIHYGYPTLAELFFAIRKIDPTYCIEVIGDAVIAYPADDEVQVSPVIRGCTVSRLYHDMPELGDRVLEAEQNISQAGDVELQAIQQLFQQFGQTASAHLGKYYTLWLGLILYKSRRLDNGIQMFTMLLARGFNHWRVRWYLARAEHATGNAAFALINLNNLPLDSPEMKEARDLKSSLQSDILTINIVYGHLPPDQNKTHRRGKVSIIWSNLPIKGCDHHLYHNAFSYRGKLPGLNILLMLEPAVVLPGEFDFRIWKHFDHVFCLFDALLDYGPKFRKIYFPRSDGTQTTPITENKSLRDSLYPLAGRKKAICLISGNKSSHVPFELYSKRVEAAQWFRQNSKIPFDVYGKPPFNLPNYRGSIPDGQKLEVLKQYRFSLCFENTNDPLLSAGYVTEKILDCLEARTIPIYLGAVNIEKYIPENCFIDFRKFADYADLDKYLRNISNKDYERYITAIDNWVCAGNLQNYSLQPFYDSLAAICAESSSKSLPKLFGDEKTWVEVTPVPITARNWNTVDTPAMWTWDLLAKAQPPQLKKGRITDWQPDSVTDQPPQQKKSFLNGKNTSLKILIAGSKFFSGDACRGYDYDWWNIHDALQRLENSQVHFFDCATETQRSGVAGMSEKFFQLASKEKPDIIFYKPGSSHVNILAECLQAVTDSTGITTVFWMNGNDLQGDSVNEISVPAVDCIITPDQQLFDKYRQAGFGRRIFKSQWAYNQFTYCTDNHRKTRELSFVGSASDHRFQVVDKLRQSGLFIDTFGAGWVADSFVSYYDMVRIFKQSKINLNLPQKYEISPAPLPRRVFEVTGCGGFLITLPMADLEEHYTPGQEIVVASAPEELIEKAVYYLAHAGERESIAERGRKRTLAEHTWAHRLREIFTHIGFTGLNHKSATGATTLLQPASPVTPVDDTYPAAKSAEGENDENIETSILVLAFNKVEYTRQCVESILHYTRSNYELVLIDNGSTDGTFEYFEEVKRIHPNTRVVRHFRNREVETISIHVLSLAKGKYIVGVANDALVHEGWLDNFISQIESAPDIGMVGPRSNNVSGPQIAPIDYNTLEGYHEFAVEWCRRHKGSNFAIPRLVGIAAIHKKEILKRIGGFDPDLPTNGRDGGYGFSDDDYSLRLALAGYRLLVADDVFVHHFGSVTAKQHRPDLFGAPQNINKEKYLRKLSNNERITLGTDGTITLRPYSLHDVIPVDERTIIQTPRVCFAETGIANTSSGCAANIYTGLAGKYNGQIVDNKGESIKSLILKIIDAKQHDFLVLIDSRLAPSAEVIAALTDYALCYPDVAVMVPVGNFAAATHNSQSISRQEVEIIPYADLSVCVLNLKIIRPLQRGLSRCENDDELLWFLQRRVRGESYFIAKANNIAVNCREPIIEHSLDSRILPEHLVKENKYSDAIDIYKNDISKDPGFAEAYYQLAVIANEERQTDLAIKHANLALQADPHYIPSLVFLARIFLAQDDAKNSALFVGQANLKQPGNPEVQETVRLYEEKFKDISAVPPKDTNNVLAFPTPQEFVEGKYSIIILTQNRLELTKKCVKSIRRNTREPHEIIFVDNASTDGTVKWLQAQVRENKNYRLIENKENMGLAKGRNQGLNMSRGEFIVLLDSDAIVGENWLTAMRECLDSVPDAGIVGPMSNAGRSIQKVTQDSLPAVDHLDKYMAEYYQRFQHRRISCRDIAGFCMLFHRMLTEKIGLLDENFDTGHFVDEDFCWRSALARYHNFIAADVFIYCQRSKETFNDRSSIDKKWTLSMSSPQGRQLAVLKATELAANFYAKGNIDQSIEALINCIKLTPEAKEIYYELTRIFIAAKRFSEAWEVIGTMPESAKNELPGLECAGYVKEGLGLDDEAAVYLEKMLALNGNYPAALNLQGILFFKKGEKEKAHAYFQKAIAADPGYGEAYANLGVLYWGIDKKEEALAYLRKGFVLSPAAPDTSSLYYSVITALGIFSETETDFLEAAKRHPVNKNLAFLYIDILLQQAKFNEALFFIQDVLDLFGLDEGTMNAALTVREKIGPLQIEGAAKKGTLSLCMIVKNEEKYLVQCLRSVRDIVDEIIIVDTGSTDKTIAIAQVFGARIFDFPWTGDFGAARNYSLEQATGQWILVLDADEIISSRNHKEIKDLISRKSSTPCAYSIDTRNYLSSVGGIGWVKNTGENPEEAGIGWVKSTKVRLFTRNKNIFFINPVHELLETSLKNAKIPIHTCKIIVHHYGKLDIQKDQRKGEEYYLLGKIKYENDPTNMKYILELAKQAHLVNKHEEAIELLLKLLSLIETNPESPSFKDVCQMSFGDPLSEIYTLLAAAYMMIDQYDAALPMARKSIENKRKLQEYVYVYAHCEIIAGSLANAFHELEDILKTSPDYPPAMILMAVVYSFELNKEKARDYFRQLKEMRVGVTPVLNKLVSQLITYGKKDEALHLINMAGENNLFDAETAKLLEKIKPDNQA